MKQLYLLRHGIAEEHGSRPTDAERKLVQEGKDKTRSVMKAITEMRYPAPELVISSSLVRARETAEIAMEEFASGAEFKQNDALAPSAEMIQTMALVEEAFKKHKIVMLVGHEPHMSSFGSALLGMSHPVLEMKKSAVAMFELLSTEAPRVRGHLTCLFPPRIGSLK